LIFEDDVGSELDGPDCPQCSLLQCGLEWGVCHSPRRPCGRDIHNLSKVGSWLKPEQLPPSY